MKSINQSAPVKIRLTIEIDATLGIIWNNITDITNWPKWHPEISETTLHGRIHPGTTFRWKNGSSMISSVLETVKPEEEFVWTGTFMGIKAVHRWILEESKYGIRVTTEESMEGLLAYVLRKTLRKQLDRSLTSWLKNLKAECER